MGLLLLCDWESFFLREVRDLPLSAWEGGSIPLHVAPGLARAKQMVTAQQGMSEDVNRGAQAYQAWLGYYNGLQRKCGFNPTQLVATANQFASCIGLAEPPALRAQTVGKMGLRGTPGLRVEGKGGVPQGAGWVSETRGALGQCTHPCFKRAVVGPVSYTHLTLPTILLV